MDSVPPEAPDPAPPTGFAIPPLRTWDQLAPRLAPFSHAMVLEMVVRLACTVPGNIVEFGVADGGSTRVIRRTLREQRRRTLGLLPPKRIFALDSFEGLREPFENAPIGAFAQPVPDLPGVEIVKGYFEDTCTPDLARRVGRVAFAHLDADLHDSTLCALRWLTPLLSTGSLLLFDQFIGGHRAEGRAFDRWRRESGTEVMRIAEFDRDPSGWGRHRMDRRVLFQVVADEERPAPLTGLRRRVARRIGLDGPP